MAYQFVHVEAYSRKAGKGKTGGHSVGSILAEARRDAGACPHVETPKPPIWLVGSSQAVEQAVAEYAAHTTDALGRGLRIDGLCLAAGVVSAPAGHEDWEGIKQASIDKLRRDYGDRLRAVVEHKDESNPHLHFYLVPKPGENFGKVHAGKAARRETPGPQKEKMLAYKEAMRAFQDAWHSEVMAEHGLARIGPGRRRLSRAEWKQEQEQVKTLAGELRDVRRERRELERLKGELTGEHRQRVGDLMRREAELIAARKVAKAEARKEVAKELGELKTELGKADQQIADLLAEKRERRLTR